MKRIVTLLLAAGLVFGAFSGAQAADIKAKGVWAFELGWSDNVNFSSSKNGDAGEDDLSAKQRFRTQIDIVASEALSGTVYFEIGASQWGADDAALGADGKAVKVKRSYIDWTVPQTDLKVRMGVQGVTLPGALGSAILDDDAAALTVSYAFNDMFGLTALWARPYNMGAAETATKNTFDEMDLFGLVAPVTLDGFKITPFVIAGSLGKDVDGATTTTWGDVIHQGMGTLTKGATAGIDNTASLFWAGAAFEMSRFDPFSLKLDLNYGKKNAEAEDADRSGWLIDGIAEYKLGMVTPGLYFWYGSGEDDDTTNGSERMPFISPVWGNSSFAYGFPGSGAFMDGMYGYNGTGSWGVGLQLADISFLQDLSHVFRVAYSKGTNSKEIASATYLSGIPGFQPMTTKDNMWEVNFDTTYKIYENLTVALELGYMKLSLDDDIWGDSAKDDAYKGNFVFTYSF